MNKYEDGHHVISNDNYHNSDGISRSRLMNFQKSPKHYISPKEFKASSAMALGSLVHNILLEPALFDEEFALVPEINKRTKLGRQQFEAFKMEHAGKDLVTEEQLEIANSMVRSILQNKDAKALLGHDALVENSIFWTDQESQLQLKSRPDLWVRDRGLIIDLKTTADASTWSFSNSAWKYGYFAQAAFASEALKSLGEKMTRFVIIAIENTEPYVPAVYVMDEAAINKAVDKLKFMLMQLKECIDTGYYPDFGTNLLCAPKYSEYDE